MKKIIEVTNVYPQGLEKSFPPNEILMKLFVYLEIDAGTKKALFFPAGGKSITLALARMYVQCGWLFMGYSRHHKQVTVGNWSIVLNFKTIINIIIIGFII